MVTLSWALGHSTHFLLPLLPLKLELEVLTSPPRPSKHLCPQGSLVGLPWQDQLLPVLSSNVLSKIKSQDCYSKQ